MIMLINRHMNSKYSGGAKRNAEGKVMRCAVKRKQLIKLNYGLSDGEIAEREKSYVTFPKLKTKFDQYSINSGERLLTERDTVNKLD